MAYVSGSINCKTSKFQTMNHRMIPHDGRIYPDQYQHIPDAHLRAIYHSIISDNNNNSIAVYNNTERLRTVPKRGPRLGCYHKTFDFIYQLYSEGEIPYTFIVNQIESGWWPTFLIKPKYDNEKYDWYYDCEIKGVFGATKSGLVLTRDIEYEKRLKKWNMDNNTVSEYEAAHRDGFIAPRSS